MKRRRIYLKMKEPEEALDIFLRHISPEALLSTERVASKDSAGRVTAKPVTALLSSPTYHSAAMDGYAVRARDTFGASEHRPLSLEIGRHVWPINTGQVMPAGTDAVIMIEDVFHVDDTAIEIIGPVFPWQNVRKVGEDMVATELLLPANHLISPYDVAALITGGVQDLLVWERPKVVIIPTGSELIRAEEALIPGNTLGKTIESNSAMLSSLAAAHGAKVSIWDIVPDDLGLIKDTLRSAIDSDAHLVVLNAGSSAGSADYTVHAIEELGYLLVHGVTMMPGKPTALGVIDGKPVMGNPGYPVSSALSFEKFALPALSKLQFKTPLKKQKMEAIVGRNIPSKSGLREFRRVITGKVGNRFVAVPLRKGAGSITTLTRANAMIEIAENAEGVEEGTRISVELLRGEEDISRTLLCIGSHDLALDILRDMLQRGHPAFYLYSNHVGSLGGLMALKKGLAHMAGTHLLDPATGTYNTRYVKRYLSDMPVALVTLVHRQQGFMVLPGNPKGIKGIEDLARPDVTFINRQAGSGTRVLLDYHLRKAGIDPDQIQGYQDEEYTHMTVAVDILSNRADTGLGILSAARALGLGFIPLAEERYDLAVPMAQMEHPGVRSILEIVRSRDFKSKIEGLGGYSIRKTGRIIDTDSAMP